MVLVLKTQTYINKIKPTADSLGEPVQTRDIVKPIMIPWGCSLHSITSQKLADTAQDRIAEWSAQYV